MSALSICDVVQRIVRQSHVSGACWEVVVVAGGDVLGNHVSSGDEAA